MIGAPYGIAVSFGTATPHFSLLALRAGSGTKQ
nr:hypothetical protein [Desulfobacterales bacterium]